MQRSIKSSVKIKANQFTQLWVEQVYKPKNLFTEYLKGQTSY